MVSKNITTREIENPVRDAEKIIDSYHMLMGAGHIQDINNEQMEEFIDKISPIYADISDIHRTKYEEIRRGWKSHPHRLAYAVTGPGF